MPTPIFAIRLEPAVRAKLTTLAKVYGSPTPGAFAREILTVVTSGDLRLVGEFNARLMDKIQGQFALGITEAIQPPKPPPKARKRPLTGKRRVNARRRT